MSLDKLKNELINEAKKEAKSITSKAEKDALKIVKEAEETAKKMIEDAKKQAKASVKAEERERIAAAKLKATRIISEAKNTAVENALKEVFNDFVEVTRRKNYSKTLTRLINEGKKELGANSIVFVNSKDKSKVKNARVIDILGGAIIASKNGRIRVNNSFESIFDSKKEELRKQIFIQLFGEKK